MTCTPRLLAIFSLTLAGCRGGSPSPARAICTITAGSPEALSAEQWFASLIQNYDRVTRAPLGEPRDCAGQPILDPSRREFEGICRRSDPGLFDARPLIADDLVVATQPDAAALVWARLVHYRDGTAYGPLAWVEFDGRVGAVRALGALRAASEDVSFELHDRWLVVHGRRCGPHGYCEAVMQIVARERGGFETLAFAEPGVCAVPAELALTRRRELVLDDGRVREYELTRRVGVGGGALVLHERLTVSERDSAEAPAKVVHQTGRASGIVRDGGRLLAPQSLWQQVLAELEVR